MSLIIRRICISIIPNVLTDYEIVSGMLIF